MRTYFLLTASVAAGLLALAGCGQAEAPAAPVGADVTAGPAVTDSAPQQAAAPAGDMPELLGTNLKVKPGLWESEADTDGEITRSQYCVGASGIPLADMANTDNPACRPQIATHPGRVTMTADCNQSGINVKMNLDYRTSQMQANGDLRMTITTPDGEASSMTSRMSSRWVSDSCPADLPPGETRVIEDGDE